MSFIPDPAILAAFTIAAIIIALTPGPDMTLFLGRTLSQGKAAGHAALFGAMSGLVIHTLLVAFGISALLAASQAGFTALKIMGAGYLLWLAIGAIRGGSSLTLNKQKTKPASFLNNWLAGISVNLLNPKIVLFFITFLPQFVAADDPAAIGKLLFLGFYFIVIGFIICMGIVAIASRFATTLTNNPRLTRFLDYSFAAIFGAFAIRILMAQRL
ncbi:MAG: LysE family translocator [Rhizobiaceae bacterium]|nr:LysE family translocator [Rhizobiaceae bacterium]